MTTAAEIFVALCFIGCGVICGAAVMKIASDAKVESEWSPYRKVSVFEAPYGVSVVTVDGKDYICARSGSGLAICPK